MGIEYCPDADKWVNGDITLTPGKVAAHLRWLEGEVRWCEESFAVQKTVARLWKEQEAPPEKILNRQMRSIQQLREELELTSAERDQQYYENVRRAAAQKKTGEQLATVIEERNRLKWLLQYVLTKEGEKETLLSTNAEDVRVENT